MEKVLDENPTSGRSYYTLSYNEKPVDKRILTFKPSKCPSGEVLRVKCKNLECGIRTQAPSQARYTFTEPVSHNYTLARSFAKTIYTQMQPSIMTPCCTRDNNISIAKKNLWTICIKLKLFWSLSFEINNCTCNRKFSPKYEKYCVRSIGKFNRFFWWYNDKSNYQW